MADGCVGVERKTNRELRSRTRRWALHCLAVVAAVSLTALAAWAATGDPAPQGTPAVAPPVAAAAHATTGTVTLAQFQKTLRDCGHCHNQRTNNYDVDTLVRTRWVVPGKPESSPVYTIIGKMGNNKEIDGGRYHMMDEAKKRLVRDYIAAMPAVAQPAPSLAPQVAPAAADAPAAEATGPATHERFMAVMQDRCVRCHQDCASEQRLLTKGWLVPGKPFASRVYKVIGKAANKQVENGTYHDVTPGQKITIRDYISDMPTTATQTAR